MVAAARRVLERPARVEQHEVRGAPVRLEAEHPTEPLHEMPSCPERGQRERHVRVGQVDTLVEDTRGGERDELAAPEAGEARAALPLLETPVQHGGGGTPASQRRDDRLRLLDRVGEGERAMRRERRGERCDDLRLVRCPGRDRAALTHDGEVLARRTDLRPVPPGPLRVGDDRAQRGDQRAWIARQPPVATSPPVRRRTPRVELVMRSAPAV
jgi:hypothetical protein